MTERVVFFSSRHKDNENISNFVPRHISFLSDSEDISADKKIRQQFQEFVNAGQPGEISRLYVSINAADPVKVNKALMHYLLDHPEASGKQVNNKLLSLSAVPENLLTRKWLLDVDNNDESYAFSIVQYLNSKFNDSGEYIVVDFDHSKSGYYIITRHGFDTRELLKKFTDVTVKKETSKLVTWKQKD